MKKFVLFMLSTLLFISAKGQTYDQTQERVNSEITNLEQRLNNTKNQIYYLENIDKKINELRSKVNGNFILKAELKDLYEKKVFATEDIKNFKIEKARIELALAKVMEVGLAGTEYRTQADMKSNLPEQMGPREYKRRSRTQVYKLSEGMGMGTGEISGSNKYKGTLVNDKTGRNEVAMFYISRTDIRNVPPVSIEIDPGKRKTWLLSAGTYQVQTVCGSYRSISVFHVDPRVINWFDGDYVYWGVRKTMSDW